MSISETNLRTLKAKELGILIEFDKLCKLLEINYSLSSGTLLGAVRHGGFIPWDDDLDVLMNRADYNRLINEGQKYLPSHLFIQTYETDKKYPLNFGKIRDTSTMLKEYSTQSIDMVTGVYIDIFPIDKISSSKFIRVIDNYLISLILSLKYSSTIEWITRSNSFTGKMLKTLLFPIAKLIGTQSLNKLETLIRTKNNTDDNNLTYGDRYTLPAHRLKDSMTMDINLFNDFEEIVFENRMFKTIKKKEEYLKIIYGDYMQLPPEEKRVFRHDFIEIDFEK
ncbi:LicD family protein [Paenibacillus nanensis]|uniref:LicD family protein n=1 Tax=Paenibacillus nanensis TaxID=393251 RepID=A0A3A1UIE6_9BACL|nr:LicD family protein [Paenibacillus nanensis]RIX45867.1 LicD family protein [Paenibacillus nanensis]